jgi:ribonuclease Z
VCVGFVLGWAPFASPPPPNHLTARQAGSIARRLGARKLVPFHFSPRYADPEVLREQAFAAWRGDAEPDLPY